MSVSGSQIRQKPLSGQLRKGNWSHSLALKLGDASVKIKGGSSIYY